MSLSPRGTSMNVQVQAAQAYEAQHVVEAYRGAT
jgi:hypothetical protein